MLRSSFAVLFLVGCSTGKSCPEGKYLSATGDCEDRQEGGSPAPEGGIDTDSWDTAGGGDDTGGGGGGDGTDVSVDQDESGVRITVNPSGYYSFGMAETGSSSDPWTGEDCYYGYYGGDGSYYNYCHTIDGDGLVLPGVESVEDLYYDSTLFGIYVDEASTTYLLIDLNTYSCWTWGHDPSYYSYFGCEEL